MFPVQDAVFTVVGFSMEPLLRNGDRVRLTPVDRNEIIPGDIIAFTNQAKNLVVHRVTAVTPGLVTQGDNNFNPDPPLSADVLPSRLAEVTRGGTSFVPEQGAAGLRVFHRQQARVKLRRWRTRCGRLVCRLLPYKVREDQLNAVPFGASTVYYWRERAIGTVWQGEWRWLWWPATFFIRRPHPCRSFPLAELLGAIAAGRGAELRNRWRPEQLQRACETGRRFGFAPFLYHALFDVLPSPLKEQFQLEYYARRAEEMHRRTTMTMVADRLSAQGIPFIWLKGGFLAYHVYPAACTRMMRDLDFLVRREDAEKAFALFVADGWIPRARDLRRQRSLFYRHHLPALDRVGFPELELHWHIFKDISTDSEKLWDYAQPTGAGSEYRFCPEMHALLSVYNSYVDAWERGLRSMLDLALLQKKFPLDRDLLQRLNADFKLNLDLGLNAAAFPEFFPEENRRFPSSAAPDVLAAIRSLAASDLNNRVVSPLGREDGGGWWDGFRTRLLGKIHPKWHKYLVRNRRERYARQLLTKKLPRFQALRIEARNSHGRF